MHAFELETFSQPDGIWVRFKIHPFQRDVSETVAVQAPVKEFRRVRSSCGHDALRPVILTSVRLLGLEWPIELTLANRDSMGFRMLLGREAVRRRYFVDPALVLRWTAAYAAAQITYSSRSACGYTDVTRIIARPHAECEEYGCDTVETCS